MAANIGASGNLRAGGKKSERWPCIYNGISPSLDIPPTGKHVGVVGCSVCHFKNGKIVEEWEYSDMLSLLQQLGVIPALG